MLFCAAGAAVSVAVSVVASGVEAWSALVSVAAGAASELASAFSGLGFM